MQRSHQRREIEFGVLCDKISKKTKRRTSIIFMFYILNTETGITNKMTRTLFDQEPCSTVQFRSGSDKNNHIIKLHKNDP